MDIKHILKISTVGFLRPKMENSRIKADSTTDREPNGQTEQQRKKKRPPLNETQFQEILEKLKKLPPVVELHWRVVIINQPPEGPGCVEIQDSLGKRLKVIGPDELWTLLESEAPHRGQILKKTA